MYVCMYVCMYIPFRSDGFQVFWSNATVVELTVTVYKYKHTEEICCQLTVSSNLRLYVMYVCMGRHSPANDCADKDTQENERHQDDVDDKIWK